LISIGPSVEKTIIEYTKHPNPQVRLQAAKVLGEIGTVQATTALTRLSRMGDPMLRWAADDALRAIRDRRAKRDEAETKDPGGSSAKKAE
jgi:HEAT repeat protein